MKRRRYSDGVIVWDEVHSPHDGTITRKWDQPSRDTILERNQWCRNNDAIRDIQGIGRLALTIPVDDLERLRRKYPDLNAPDSVTRSLAWKKFMASPEALPYKVSKG